MKQFDILENPNRSSRHRYPFLIVLQHDRLAEYRGVIVAPLLIATTPFEKTRLHPNVSFQGQEYLLITEELAAMPRANLGPVVGSAADYRYALIGALDMIFTGI